MADYPNVNFYAGADYGLDPNYGEEFLGFSKDYRFSASQFGFPTDPRTANQLSAVSQKLNTGAKTIEVSGVSAEKLESIPKQHFTEINRLKKLTGVDLTFHGPLVEPSGWEREGGWNETNQEGAKRQIWSAVERAHDLEPDGNIVVTFHSTKGLPELSQRIKTKKGEELRDMAVVDEHSGEASFIRPKKDYLLKEGERPSPLEDLDRMNKERWIRQLSQTTFHVEQGRKGVESAFRFAAVSKIPQEKILELYSSSKTEEGQKSIKSLEPPAQEAAKKIIDSVNFGEVYLRESYIELQEHFNKAWTAVEKSGKKEDMEKLKKFREELKKTISKTNFDNPQNLVDFGEVIQTGVNTLNSLSSPPKLFTSMNDFIVAKSADTFADVALRSYKKFKDTAPIISIENPPAGGGISRGEDLRKLVEESRKKFIQKAREEFGMSESEAKKQAEKLIGVTWDVGHINMLRKYGYSDKELIEETKKVAPLVKHIHLSDNFGFEHTELPMGMGDVPIKQHLEAIGKYNKQLNKIKQIAETGTWFEPFKITPVRETLRAFGSPVYSMQMAPYWNQAAQASGGYFAGYGRFLPEQHFSLYGSGFSNLPPELGGQLGGRSRVSGAPME